MSSTQKATFVLSMDASGLKKAAVDSELALNGIQGAVDKDVKALVKLKTAMYTLQSSNVVSVKQYQKLKAKIDETTQRIGVNQGKIKALRAEMQKAGIGTASFSERVAAFSEQAAKAPGPLGAMAGQFSRLSELVGGAGIAAGIIAIGAAVIALNVATVLAVKSLFEYGLAQGDARRSELLRLEGLSKIRGWLIRTKVSGEELQKTIDEVAASSPLDRESVAKYGVELQQAGVKSKDLKTILEATAIKSSTQGEAQAAYFKDLAVYMSRAGGNVAGYAQTVKNRLGGIAQRQMLSLTVQARKLQEAQAALFAGVNIEPVLKAKKALNDMFSTSTASGRALQAMIEVIMVPLVKAVEYVGPLVKKFFQGMIIAALTFTVLVLQVGLTFKDVFGSVLPDNMDLSNAAVNAGIVVMGLLTAAVGTAAVVTGVAFVGALWSAVTAAGALFVALAPVILAGLTIAAPFVGAALLIAGAIKLIMMAWEGLDFNDVKQLGVDMMQGLADGLLAGISFIPNAIMKVSSYVVDAFKNNLGIHSPSKVFADLGQFIPQGLAVGIEADTSKVDAAVSKMIKIPMQASVEGGASNDASGSQGATSSAITVGDIHVHLSEGKGTGEEKGKEIGVAVRDALQEVLSTLVLQGSYNG